MPVLACYAASEETSRGRLYPEEPSRFRNQYQRDRDRIIHSSAFRRLEYKTQVFLSHEGDMYRTRLTHSIEVSQIGRTVARALALNEDLTEAICLAHDLGHTPFGHAGQTALNQCMKSHGGFEHNLQSLRVVDVLEDKYMDYPGLNLMYETREGILKHCSLQNARALGDLGKRFVDNLQVGLEAQIANIADEIAYNNHDVDDGIRSGLISIDELRECEIFEKHYHYVVSRWPDAVGRRLTHELIRRMINELVTDLVETSRSHIEDSGFRSVEDVRNSQASTVVLSEKLQTKHLQLKRFLHSNLYKHETVLEMAAKSRLIIQTLFDAFLSEPLLLPPLYRQPGCREVDGYSAATPEGRVRDYIAGMTDRFAMQEYERLVQTRP